MSASDQKNLLPTPIAEKLRVIQRRMAGVGIVTAVVTACAVLLSAMLLAMLVDYLATLYDSSWRSVLTYAAFTGAAATLAGWAALALRKASRVEKVAQEVDRRTPYLEERWSTVTHFAESAKRDPKAGAGVHPAMLQQVTQEAVRGERHVDANEVVSLSGVIRAFLALNVVTLVLVLAVIADWQRTTVLFQRFWSPGSNISATQIVASPGDAVVGRGEPLMLTAAFTGPTVDEARLFLRPEANESTDSGIDTITLIPREASGIDGVDALVTHRIRKAEESFGYRMRGGDGQTPWHEVTVADRPAIEAIELEITAPEYRHEPTKRIKKMPRRVAAVAGSQLRLSIKPTAELKSLVLQQGDHEITLTKGTDGWYRWRTELSESIQLTPLLTEPYGLTMRRPPSTRVTVYPDRPPVVRVISPNNEIAVTPDDTVEIEFIAEDDNGIGAAELVIMQEPLDPEGEPIVLETIPIDLQDSAGKKRVRGSTQLDLSKYPLVDGSALSYAVRVIEKRSPGVPVSPPPAATAMASARRGVPERPSQNSSAAEENEQAPALADKGPEETPSPAPEEQQPASTLADAQRPTDAAAQHKPNAKDDAAPASDHTAVTTSDEPTKDPMGGIKPLAETLARAGMPSAMRPAQDKTTPPRRERAGPTENAAESIADTSSSPPTASAGRPAEQPTPKPDSATMASTEMADDDTASNDTVSPQNQSTAGTPNTRTNAAADQAPAKTPSLPAGATVANTSDPRDPSERATRMPTGEAPSGKGASQEPTNRSTQSRARSLVAASPEDQSEQDTAAPSKIAQAMDTGAADKSSKQASETNAESKDQQLPGDSNMLASQADGGASASANKQQDANSAPGGSSQQGKMPDNPLAKNLQMPPSAGAQASTSNQPTSEMTRRRLDVGAQTASSNQMRIKVDEYAGSFKGQQRGKLEVAIAPDLVVIEDQLLRGQKLSRSVLDDLEAGGAWQARHHRDISSAEQAVKRAQVVARKLQGRTHNTPYAFLGLQIADISAANLTPARDYFWKSLQADEAERRERVRQGWQQVGQALDRLASLTQKYERVKREYALSDATQRIAKMYRVFIEDAMLGPLGGGGGDRGSKFRRQMVEFDLDEEYLARLQEVLEMRRELRAELAKILAEDPRLLRRFMSSFRSGADNLRNQLSGLRERQDELTREVLIWNQTASAPDSATRAATVRSIVTRRRLAEPADLAKDIGGLADRFEAWMPLDSTADSPELRSALDEANALAADTRELALAAQRMGSQPLAPAGLRPIFSQGQALYQRLAEFEVRLRRLGSSDGFAGDAEFIVNRLAETRSLITATSSWIKRIDLLAKGSFHGAVAIEQYELATATDALAGDLADVETDLAGLLQTPDGRLPSDLATACRELLATLDEEATPNQLASAIALERGFSARISQRQEAASEALEKAENQFDDLIKKAIVELDKLPVQDPIAQLLEDPTLDEILSQLEQESDLEAALGIPDRRSNLQVIDDWMRGGQGGGGGGGGGGGLAMAMRQMRQEQQRMSRAAQRARARAMKRIKEDRQVVKTSKPKDMKREKSTDWNQLISTLSDDLLQGRDKLPPKRYREAIEQYRTLMSRVAADDDAP